MAADQVEPIRWEGEALAVLDQTRLPHEEAYLRCDRVEQVAEAICSLRVRGAPLIGIAAAYAIALAARGEPGAVAQRVAEAAARLRATRPTARNLFWAVDRMVARAGGGASADDLAGEAIAIHREDAERCRGIGEHGSHLIPDGGTVLTICNAGALATGGEGTALAVIKAAHAASGRVRVLACETRPLLQGARLTMWELMRAGIPATVISDGAAGACMGRGMVDVVVTGADRIARNGDTANKVGTYALAVLAHHHRIPFYIAAPMSTVDPETPDGSQIPIEERDPREVLELGGARIAPAGAAALNPAFDVTPADLITGIVTERGVMEAPYERAFAP